MINGYEYAWEDITIVMFDRIINGITDLKYKTKREQVEIYGRGAIPVALGKSKKEFEGSITLLQSEVEALQRSLTTSKDLTDIQAFDITISYIPEGSLQSVTDILKDCRFTEFEKGMKTGDTHREIELPLRIGNIVYNV